MSSILKCFRLVAARKFLSPPTLSLCDNAAYSCNYCFKIANILLQPSNNNVANIHTPLLDNNALNNNILNHTVLTNNTTPQRSYAKDTTSLLHPPQRSYAKRAAFKKDKKDKKTQAAVKRVSDEDLLDLVDLEAMRQQLDSSLHLLAQQFEQQLALRPTLSSLGSVVVETEEGRLPLSQLAQLQQKTPQLMVVSLVEHPELTAAARNAIIAAAVNINPQVEGTTLYLPIQKVTRDHREALAKAAKGIADKLKDRMRGVQHNFEREVKKHQAGFSEDLVREAKEVILQVARENMVRVDEILQQKQQQLLNS